VSKPYLYKITWSIVWGTSVPGTSQREETSGELPDEYVGLGTALKAACAWKEKMKSTHTDIREHRTEVVRVDPPITPQT
jgi:hypothetical protein